MFRRTKKRRSNCDEITHRESHGMQTCIPIAVSKDEGVSSKNLRKAAVVIGRFIGQIDDKVSRQNRLLIDTLEASNENCKRIEDFFETASDCQKLTAELANQNLERHALYPAIMAVDALGEIITQTANQAEKLLKNQQLDENAALLARSMKDVAQIADSKMSQLQISAIKPEYMDDLDSDCHQIVKVVSSTDPEQHKKVKETVNAGLLYNGTVLRQAKVIAYRFTGEADAD